MGVGHAALQSERSTALQPMLPAAAFPTPYPALPPSRGKASAPAVVLLVLAVAINAAVCGMLSGPFDRYEARLLWLVPCAAMLLHEARRRPS